MGWALPGALETFTLQMSIPLKRLLYSPLCEHRATTQKAGFTYCDGSGTCSKDPFSFDESLGFRIKFCGSSRDLRMASNSSVQVQDNEQTRH